MKMAVFAGLSISLGLAGCALDNSSPTKVHAGKSMLTPSQENSWNLLLGTWYGSQPTKSGGKHDEIVKRMPNGTYKFRFRTCDKSGKCWKQTEVGIWGVSGPIYFTIFLGWVDNGHITPASPGNPYNDDAYRIIKLNKKIFEYKAYSDGDRFIDKRVPANFHFPGSNREL